jgi:IS30 family transposase
MEGFRAVFNSTPLATRKRMTYDPGQEMARHAEITQRICIAIHFCDPHCPCHRGSNENINGLIRQYLPKDTDQSENSKEQLDAIALQLTAALGT